MPPLDDASAPYSKNHSQADTRTSHDLNENSRDDSGASSDDSPTNSSDEFWEDAAKEAGEQHLGEARAKRGRWLYLSFMRLYRPIRVFLVAILGAGLFITPYIVVRFSFPNSDVRPHVTAWSVWFTITWALAAAVSILIDLLPRIVVSLVLYIFGKPPEHLTTELELFLAVSFWLKLVLDGGACWITLSVMRGMVQPPGGYWIYVNRAIAAIFAALVILLVEKCFLQFIAIRFHRKALADRLVENQLALKALDRLSNAQVVASKKNVYGRKRGYGHKTASSVTTSASFDAEEHNETLSKSNNAKKRRRKAVTSVILDQVGDVIGAVALKNSTFNRNAEFGSLYSARKLARKLFDALSDTNARRNLVVTDFYPYFPTREEAEIAFHLIDQDGNGDIERREMREAVQRIYRERKALTASLKDVGNIVAKLDGVLLFIALLITAFAALLIFDRANTLSSLVPLATVVLGFSFIFGHSAQTLFESLIFIFSTHVFDVGDLVMIDDQVLFVREFGLFSTTFRRVDGQEIIAPNAILAANKLIHNLRRSSSMWETVTLNIGYDTPLEVVEQLKVRLKGYVAANCREWSDISIIIDKIEYQNAIFININMQHKTNWQNWGGRWERRTALMRHLKTLLEELEITYTKTIQPVILQYPATPSTMRGVQRPSDPRSRDADSDSLGNAGRFSVSGGVASSGQTTLRSGPGGFST
ncbi:Mechanosensitive ion channel-domain-containing protein [Hysterangium stoloniferum]|nr:Mechanosensitive ion channel-domain-containing protein [Hysterangium stoloniferum]